ncbi:uncharacterized protein LOC113240194 [Hyposmocoma kahamanoa]|uniref:uncharacterized protein LOC113240194 n=1 Tax=Hyposmocoma kahamanoa TaxID=1477025 RepID=UPI000E6D95DE|nr:uncharacterized protein LOC113240194 [Hyposmocoma kahamanoa]
MDKKFEEKLTKQDKKAEKEAKITEKGKDEDETVSEEQFKKEKRCSSAPKTASQNLRDSIAHAENIIIPLESKTLSQKEVALRKMAAVGALLPEGRTLSEKALITCVKEATRTVPKVCSEKVKKAKAEGLLTPSEDKSPCEYEKMIRKLHQQGLPLPEPKTAEKKALIEKIKKDEVSMKLKNVTKSEHVSKTKQVRPTSKISTKKLKRLKSAGLLTPLNGKSTERKEKILRGLAINDVPLPVAKTSSEKKIIDKVRRDLGLPPQPRTSSENLKYKKATAKGLITPLDAKSMAQKEKILRGLADIGVPLPEGRTPSEKALIGQIKTKTSSKVPTTLKPSITNIPSQRIRKSKDGGLMTPLEGRTPSEKALITHAKETRSSVSEQTCSEKLKELEKEKKLKEIEEKCKKAKAGGLQTPLEGKTRAQKQKVLQDLAKHGLPLPEGKTPSEKKIIDKVRKEMGYPAEPKTLSQKLRVTKAHAEGVITPLEGKTALQKEVALKKMAAARVPLPEGRTASEKALITRIKETRSSVCKQTSSEKLKELEKEKKLKEIEEKLKKDKAEGLLTPLEGKTRAQKQKILRDLVKHDKVRKEMGYPVEPKTLSQKLRVTKAHAEGIITPLEGKTASQKEVALKKMAAAGVPLPEGRTASEKALITHVKETPETEGIRRAKSISPPMSPKKFEKFDINTAKSLKEGKKSDECICNIFNVPAKMSPTVKPLHEKSPEEKEEHIRGLVTRGLPLPQPNTASEKKIIDKVIMEMGYPPEPKTTTQKLALAKAHEASIIKPLQGMTRPEKEKTLRKMAAAGVLLPEGRTASEKSLIAAIKATSPRLSKIASEKIRQAKAEGLLTPLEGKIDSEKERILRGRAKKGLPLPEGKTASEKRIINKVRKEMGYPPEPTCVSEKLRLTKAHAEGIIEPLEGKSDKDKEKMLQQMAAAGIPLPEGRTPSEKALIAAVTTPATVPTEKLTKSKTKERASGFKADPDKLRKAEVKKKTTKKEESVSPKLKTSAEKGTLEKPAGKKRTEKVTTPKGSRYKKSKSVTTTAAGAGIRGEIENIAITTTCDRSCGCDKKKIRFKHSYVKIRVTSPDFSSLCDCPDECIPCVQSGIILDNEGIKVTVGRVAGFPSFTPNLPRRKTLQDSRYVSLEHSFISLYQNVVRNSYLNVLKEALCKNLYEMYKAKMNHTWETESNIRHPSQLQRRLRKDCVYNVQGGYFVGGGHSEISFHRAEADRLFYEPERSYISSAKDTASAHNFNKNESTISTNLKCMSHDSILIMRTESTLSLLSNAYSELGSVSVVSFLGSTMSANNSRRSQSLPNVSNSDMDTDPYFQDLYCNTTKATLSTVYADSDSSKSFLQYTHSKDNDVLVYRISKHNLKEDENNKLNVDPLTDKSVAAISEKSEVESEDLFKIVRELLDHEFIGRRSSVYLLVSSNEADSDASSEANDSIINIKLCGFKNSKDKGNSINSIQVLFSNKTEKKKANDTLMIEVTAEQFYKKDRKLHGFTSKESTDTKNFNDIDKQNRKVHINTFKCNPITKKTKYAKRNIYRHDVRRTVLMHHQSTITEVNKSTGTMTHCGITAERPFEEHCRDAKMNTSAAADRPRWCRQHSAPNLAEPVKLISSNVQFIGNINILPEKVPRGITPEIFLSFGENLMWQCKDPSPEQLLGRIGRMGSEGTLSFANAFPECFKEDTQKTSYLKCSCDYRRKALFREGFSNGTRTEPPPTKFGTYPRVCYQSSFGTTHKPIVRDQSGQTHKKVCSSCTRRLGRRIKNCDHNLSEDDEDIWIEETKKQSLTYNAKYNKHHRKRKMLKSSRNDLISYQPGDIASLGSCRATYCEVNVTGVPSLRSTLHQYFCQHERRKGEVYAVPSCSCCMSPHQNSTVLDLINYKKDKKVKRERQSSVVRALRAGTGPIIPQRRPSCEPCCCAARNICEEQKSKEDDAASAAVLSSAGPVIVARSCTSFCRRASAPMSALEILTTPVPGQLITLCDPCGHKRKGYIEVLHPPPSQRTSLAAGLYQDIYEGYACNKWDYEGKLDQYTDAPDMSVIVTKNLLKNLKDLRDTLIPILADTGLDLQGEPQSMVHTADEALSPTRTSNASVEPTMSEQKYSSDSVTRHRPKLKDFLDPATLPPNMPMPEYEVDKDGNLHINVDSYARSTSLPSHHLQQYNRLGGTSTCSMVVPEEDCNIACDGVACQITGNKPVLRGMSTCSMVVPEEDCNFECEGVACQITGNKPELLNTEETGIHLASCSDAVLTEGDYLDADYSKKDYAEETYGYCSYAGLEYPGLEFSPSNYEGAEYASPDYGAPEYGGLQYIHQGYSGGRYVDPTYGYQQYANTEYADSINPDFGPSFMVDAENYIESKDDDDFLQNSAYLDQSVDTQEIAALTSSSCCRISVTNTIAESTQKGYCCKHRRHKVRHQMPKQMFSTGDQTLPSQRPVKVQVTASLSGFTAQPRMLTARRVSTKSEKSCGPNPSQCVGCRLPRTPHRNPMGAFEGDARPGQTCCGKIPADIRPGCAFDKRISKQSSSVKGRCGPRNQAPCQNLRIPCDNPSPKPPNSPDACRDLNPCCRRAIETLMEDKDKESKKGKERTKSRSRDYAKDRKNKERTIINGGEERCCTSSTCPASPPPPCCGSGPFSDTTSEGTEGISSLNALPAAGSLVAQGPPQARGSPQAWGSPPSLGPPSEQGRQTPPPMLPPRKSTCPGGGGVPLCNQKCQRHGGQCRPYIHTRQTCPGSKTNESFCSAKLGPIAKGPCPRQKCFVPHMTKAPSMLQPTATMVGQVSADLSAGRGAIPEGNEASDLKLPPQPTKSRERTWENEVCPGMSCIGEEAVTIPTCGLLSCPFKGGIEFSCGPTCGKSKSLYPLAGSLSGPAGVTSNICQCKTKSPLTFRTCICPGFECPRIELETNWPCPCPLPREELHLGDHDPKQVAAERSKLTENTSGFKLSMEKKGLAFEGEISFDEALKFFSDHPEYLPANNTSSQTLVVPDRYHGECCCEDSEMLYDLTSCPGDEPFVSDRIERLQKMEAGRKKEKIPFLIPIREKFKKNKQSDKDKHRYNEKKFTIKDKTVINNKRNACYGQEDIKGKLSELTSANKPKISSPLVPVLRVPVAGSSSDVLSIRFSPKEVHSIINKMERGKSPGHDGLSIEHLRYAGVHLPRVMALFFKLCMSHGYLPDDLMYTMVVPVIKNKTGDASDLSNYRPISLATVIAKVLGGLLDKHLDKVVNLHDSQFGFRPGLSTESAILCLKQTVQYYACYLDLSKAFDLVSYNTLWHKLECETNSSHELTAIFKYWYSHQRNRVRWADAQSDVYKLECGVRQGG